MSSQVQNNIDQQQQQQQSSTSRLLRLNYKSPQEAFTEALNFKEDHTDGQNNNDAVDSNNMRTMMKNILKSMNDSKFIYPGIAIVVMSLLVVVILMQRISAGVKFLAVLILLVFITFTVFLCKN